MGTSSETDSARGYSRLSFAYLRKKRISVLRTSAREIFSQEEYTPSLESITMEHRKESGMPDTQKFSDSEHTG